MSPPRIGDLVLTVGELATNTLRCISVGGILSIWVARETDLPGRGHRASLAWNSAQSARRYREWTCNSRQIRLDRTELGSSVRDACIRKRHL